MTPAYAVTLQQCLELLELALQEAEASIPDDIMKAHWVKFRTSPAAWNEMYHAHMHESVNNPEMVAALFALAMGFPARTAIQGILDEVNSIGREITLPKLSRMRR